MVALAWIVALLRLACRLGSRWDEGSAWRQLAHLPRGSPDYVRRDRHARPMQQAIDEARRRRDFEPVDPARRGPAGTRRALLADSPMTIVAPAAAAAATHVARP